MFINMLFITRWSPSGTEPQRYYWWPHTPPQWISGAVAASSLRSSPSSRSSPATTTLTSWPRSSSTWAPPASRSGRKSLRSSDEILHFSLPGPFVISWSRVTLIQRQRISFSRCSDLIQGGGWLPRLPWLTPSSVSVGPVLTTHLQVPQTHREIQPRVSLTCQTPP